MRINFDLYTNNATAAAEAAVKTAAVCPKDGDVNLRYDADDKVWNIMGSIDHRDVADLFTFFEENNFSADYSDFR
jgi:hypothetical protein